MLVSRAVECIESPRQSQNQWWRDAVTYQIYIRSFADGNGDGIGDIEGIISRLDYLKKLGVDAIWITPWYPSPQRDNGYDVADFMDINPEYGTLEIAQKLIEQAHRAGIRIIIDIVPNHSSNEHLWFKEALDSPPNSPERNRYLFREGKGKNGSEPPNNWQSIFGGAAWSRVVENDGTHGQWYCHIFAAEQPDFNWENQEVKNYFIRVLRFWLDRGVDGFRIDVAHGLVKAAGLPDAPVQQRIGLLESRAFPFWDQEGVHDIYREWRKLLDSYPNQRMAVAEAWVNPPSRSALYVRPDELANTFNFDFLTVIWDCASIKSSIDRSIDGMSRVGAPATWVLNNHDVVRAVDRLDLDLVAGQGETTEERLGKTTLFNIDRGTRRSRAAALLMLALPGAAYLYQGEELGLPEVRGIPADRLQDPIWQMSGHTDRGRDGCRVPLPWKASANGAFGFSDNADLTPHESWLPQPSNWGHFSVELQEDSTVSMLNLYRTALRLRKTHPQLRGSFLRWVESDDRQFVYTRTADADFLCQITFEVGETVPPGYEVLLSSQKIQSGLIPPETTVWLQRVK